MAGAQHEGLTYLDAELFLARFGFGLLFFAGFCVLNGVLIARSGFMPPLLGTLLIAAGVAYAINSLTAIVAPAVADALFPWILLPPLVGELSLALWLVVKGPSAQTARAREGTALRR